MSTTPKHEAWRVAGNLVTEYATDLLSRCTEHKRDDKARALALHLRDAVAPSLYRRADIIESRPKRCGRG